MMSLLRSSEKNQNNLRHRETVYLGVGGARKGLLHQLLLLLKEGLPHHIFK